VTPEAFDELVHELRNVSDELDWMLDHPRSFLAAAVERGTLEECIAPDRHVMVGTVWEQAWRLPEEASGPT
jgi:hypothetical protein